MPTVKVWNENKYEHVEMFKGKEIRLAPGIENAIEMDYIEACEFQGQFTPPAHKDDPRPERRFKMIRVETPKEPVIMDDNVVHATGQKAASVAEVLSLVKEFAALNPERQAVDPKAVGENAEVAALKKQVAELTALVKNQLQPERKKPGPKPKATA